jgi:hypothetical protein
VDAELLTVKWQITNGTTADSSETDLRMLTAVDGLDYNRVYFTIGVGGAEKTVSSNRVFETIKAGDVLISNPAAVFGPDACYFVTFTMLDISCSLFDTEFTITAGWETLDGTKVGGGTRILRISEDFS